MNEKGREEIEKIIDRKTEILERLITLEKKIDSVESWLKLAGQVIVTILVSGFAIYLIHLYLKPLLGT